MFLVARSKDKSLGQLVYWLNVSLLVVALRGAEMITQISSIHHDIVAVSIVVVIGWMHDCRFRNLNKSVLPDRLFLERKRPKI